MKERETRLRAARGRGWWLIALATGLAASSASADLTPPAGASQFTLRHAIGINVNPRAGETFRVRWTWNDTARARFDNAIDPGVPNPQNGVMGPLNPPAAAVRACRAIVGGLPSKAESESEFNVAANGVGFHEVRGYAFAGLNPQHISSAGAYARSTLAWNIGVMNRRGRIHWNPKWRSDTIRGSASNYHDPLLLRFFDPETTDLLEDSLWDVSGSTSEDTSVDLTDGMLSINGTAGTLRIAMDSPFLTSPRGMLDIQWADGAISGSTDSGLWDGLLPAVGTPVSMLSIPLFSPDGLDLDFDYGGSAPMGYDMEVAMDGDGTTEQTQVPLPGSVVLLTIGCVDLIQRRKR